MNTMIICKVDNDNKYTGDTRTVSSRLILPKNWIIIDPPVLQENQIAVFNGITWNIVDN